MTKLCEGRVAIVTGGGRGIGREYCLMLAAEGAKVIVNDLGASADGSGADMSAAQTVVNEIRELGGEAVANGSDVSDWDQAKAMVDQAVDTFGRLDILINNAGILRDRMLSNMSEAEWDAVIKVHLKGTFAPTRHAVGYWRDINKTTGQPVNARIINTTSASGIYGNVGQSNYGAAKGGIATLTIITAKELARYGITVNAIAPGAITRLTENLLGPNASDAEWIRKMDPRWIAPIAVWLASNESSDVTGRIFQVTGSELGIAEGWQLGPFVEPVEDPNELGPIVLDMIARARGNAEMSGKVGG